MNDSERGWELDWDGENEACSEAGGLSVSVLLLLRVCMRLSPITVVTVVCQMVTFVLKRVGTNDLLPRYHIRCFISCLCEEGDSFLPCNWRRVCQSSAETQQRLRVQQKLGLNFCQWSRVSAAALCCSPLLLSLPPPPPHRQHIIACLQFTKPYSTEYANCRAEKRSDWFALLSFMRLILRANHHYIVGRGGTSIVNFYAWGYDVWIGFLHSLLPYLCFYLWWL